MKRIVAKQIMTLAGLVLVGCALVLSGCGSSDTGPVSIDFAKLKEVRPGSLKAVTGLSDQEPFGIWSDGPAVSFEFNKPLPKKFELSLTAYAFGPNAGQDCRIAVGSSAGSAAWPADNPEARTVSLDNPGGASVLVIEIPQPTSPSELGINADGRKLGLAFYQLTITPRN